MKRKQRRNFALDALNVFLADVRDGVGPYLTLLLVGQPGWSGSRIGWALATTGVAGLIMTGPAGYLLDRVRRKSAVLAVATIAIAIGVYALTLTNEFWQVLGWQLWIGTASAFMGPGIVALSLGAVGPNGLSTRIGRNEMFNHGGNFAAASLAGFLAHQFSVLYVFYLVMAMCVFSLTGLAAAGRGISPRAPKGEGVMDLFTSRDFAICLLVSVFFQLANAPQLALAVQLVHAHIPGAEVGLLARGIVIAQLSAIPAAGFMGYVCRRYSGYLAMRLGLLAITGRALLFALAPSSPWLELAQVFDGIAAGAISVAPVLVVFALFGSSGRLSTATGLLASAIALGASAAQILGGYIFEHFGGPTTFLILAIAAGATIPLTFRRLPKTHAAT